MKWFNEYGLVILAIIMIPNIVYAIKCNGKFEDTWHHKKIELLEQIGRYGCFFAMVINIPYTWFGFWFSNAFYAYLIVNGILVLAYCIIWGFFFNDNGRFRALSLSIIPSIVFLFSGIVVRSIFLIVFALIFAPCHILISYKSATLKKEA